MILNKIVAKKEPSSITKYWSDKKDKDKTYFKAVDKIFCSTVF